MRDVKPFPHMEGRWKLREDPRKGKARRVTHEEAISLTLTEVL